MRTDPGGGVKVHTQQSGKQIPHQEETVQWVLIMCFSQFWLLFICTCYISQLTLKHTQWNEFVACSWINNFNFFSSHYVFFFSKGHNFFPLWSLPGFLSQSLLNLLLPMIKNSLFRHTHEQIHVHIMDCSQWADVSLMSNNVSTAPKGNTQHLLTVGMCSLAFSICFKCLRSLF